MEFHKVSSTSLKLNLKKALYDFYQMRTMISEKLEKDQTYQNINDMLKIIEKIENQKKIQEVFLIVISFFFPI